MEVEIEFKEPLRWISDMVKTHSASVRIRDVRMSGEGVKDLIEIFIPPGATSPFSNPLKRNETSRKEDVTITDNNHITVIMDAHQCSVCRSITDWDLFLIEAYSTETGNVIMKYLVPDEQTVSGFLTRLTEDKVIFTLLKKRNLTKRSEITARQEFVVKTALELGFFDYPKRINLEGISSRLNVSYVTLAEILRRAEKNIISAYFRKKGV